MAWPINETWAILPVPGLKLVLILLLGYAVYTGYTVIRNLYFSPLARFPGPKLAAATGWYEFYHQWWRNGQYIFEIEKMHMKYGKLCVSPKRISAPGA